MQVLEMVQMNEKNILQLMNELHKLSEHEHDAALEQFVERELISGQVALVKKLSDELTELNRSGPEGLGLFIFDEHLK